MRLIDADALKSALFDGGKNLDRVNGNKHFEFGIITALDAVDAMPTVDPVRRGKWMDGKCSYCGVWSTYHNFCPHCGADMRGDLE